MLYSNQLSRRNQDLLVSCDGYTYYLMIFMGEVLIAGNVSGRPVRSALFLWDQLTRAHLVTSSVAGVRCAFFWFHAKPDEKPV